MLRKFLFALLNGQTGAGDRIYPVVLPQGAARPAIVYQEAGGGSIHSAKGGQGVSMTRATITAIADTYDAADDLLEQVRVLIDGFRGSAGGVTVQHCLVEDGSKHDVPYVAAGNEPQTRFGKSADFSISVNEAFPTAGG